MEMTLCNQYAAMQVHVYLKLKPARKFRDIAVKLHFFQQPGWNNNGGLYKNQKD